MNLADSINHLFTGDAVNRISGTLGQPPDKVKSALNGGIPAVLGSLVQLTTRPGGARALLEGIRENEATAPESPSGLQGEQASGVMESGSRMLSSLLGNNTTEGIAQAVSRFSGLNLDSTKNLIALILPLILGKIGSSARSAGVSDASGLSNFLSSQAPNIAAAMPAGLKEQLNAIPGVSSLTDPLRGATPGRGEAVAAGQRAMSTPHREKAWPSWLIPAVVALAALIVLGYWLWPRGEEKGRELAKEETSAVRPADERETGAEGEPRITGQPIGEADRAAHGTTAKNWMGDLGPLSNTELGREMTSTFTHLAGVFADVRDSASAQEAGDKLRDVANNVEAWETKVHGLPEDAKRHFHQVINRALPSIESASAEALNVPGAEQHLRTWTDRIIEKLRSYKHEPQVGAKPAGT